MNYKKLSIIGAVLGLSCYTMVCAATVPEMADENAPDSKAIIADKQDKKVLGKQRNGVQITTKQDKLVVSNKPVSKVAAGTIKPVQQKNKLLQERDGEFYFAGTQLPQDYRSISIMGATVADKSQAVAYIKSVNPKVKLACTVEQLVDFYWEEAEREQVRPDLALAQSLVETAAYAYGGDVIHQQNNFCGLGTTGGGVKGASFATPQLGVRAHIQHLLAYAKEDRPTVAVIDPRYELAHNLRLSRGLIDTWYGLNGTWATGSLYCEKIMATYQKILALPVTVPKAAAGESVKKNKKQKKNIKERVKVILDEKNKN